MKVFSRGGESELPIISLQEIGLTLQYFSAVLECLVDTLLSFRLSRITTQKGT